jgi:hypothetical protein
VLLKVTTNQRRLVNKQHCGRGLGRLSERIAAWDDGRYKGAFRFVAVLRPMIRMICVAIVAATMAVGTLPVSRLHVALTFASVRMVPTAAHHQVNRKHHGG